MVMIFRALILFFLSLAARGATGDIVSIAVETNGWMLVTTYAGLNTNGTHASGLDAENALTGSEKFTLSVSGPGFNSAGQAITRVRNLLSTHAVRWPYSSNAYNADFISGGNLISRSAGSDWIFSGDTVTANVSAGYYTSDANSNNAASAVSVSNASPFTYPKPIANWNWPGWNRETGSTMRLRVVGFHGLADGGQPLERVDFIVKDQHGNTVTQSATNMTLLNDVGDALPHAEYYADIPLTTFTNLDELRCDFVAYPRHGTNVFDTRDNLYTGHTSRPTSVTNLCDRLNLYTDAVAVVGTAGASPSVTNVAANLVNPIHYFGTFAAAITAIAAYNNANFGHNDAGGAIIYAKNNITQWSGATHSVTAIPKARLIIKPYPGESVTLTGDTGTDDAGDRICFDGIGFNWASANVPLSGIEQLWIKDSPSMLSVSTAPIQTCTVVWVTGGAVGTFAQGLQESGTQNTQFMLRGVNLDGFNQQIRSLHVVGCNHPNTNGPSFTVRNDKNGMTAPHEPGIWFNNFFGGSTIAGSTPLVVGEYAGLDTGFVVAQNVIEYSGPSTTANACFFGTEPDFHFTNIIVWNNTIAGRRNGWGYNEEGSDVRWRVLWSWMNNIMDVPGRKNDLIAPQDGDRVGGWHIEYGVGCYGNFYVHCDIDNAATAFLASFVGVGSYQPPSNTTNIVNYPNYIDRAKANDDNVNTRAGGGNYRPRTEAPMFTRTVTRHVLPFDITGKPRTPLDPPGAYAAPVWDTGRARASRARL